MSGRPRPPHRFALAMMAGGNVRAGPAFVSAAICLLCAAGSGEAQQRDQRANLHEAIQQGLVEAEFQGRGASTGDSIIVKLTNLTTSRLEVTIEPGTVLKSVSGAVQDMIVERVRGVPVDERRFRPIDRIVLAAKLTERFILLAYCLNFDRANPGADSRFSVATVENPGVKQLFALLPQLAADQRTVGAIQIAVWVITDDVTRRQLQSRFPATEADIASARQLLERAGINVSTKRLFR